MTDSTLYRLVDSVIDTSTPPETWLFGLNEIEAILSKLPRYLGRSDRSVWEHSKCVASRTHDLFCTDRGEKSWAEDAYFRALYHDASEAFTGDIPGPIKHLIPGLKDFEQKLQNCVYAYAGVSSEGIVRRYGSQVLYEINRAVKEADREDYENEQDQFKELQIQKERRDVG